MTTVSGRKSSSWWISSAAAPSSSPWSGEDPHWAPPARGKGRGSADCPLCPSLRPRSIRHLQDASGTDGKGEAVPGALAWLLVPLADPWMLLPSPPPTASPPTYLPLHVPLHILPPNVLPSTPAPRALPLTPLSVPTVQWQ